MAHPLQTDRDNEAARTSAVSDAAVISSIHCALRVTIMLLGSPLPFAQIIALALAGLAMMLLGLSRPCGGRHWPNSDDLLGTHTQRYFVGSGSADALDAIGEE